MDIGGQFDVAGDLVTRFAVPSRDRDLFVGPSEWRLASATVYFAPYRRDAWVVGHAAVHRDERAAARLRLNRNHPVQRHPGAGADRPAGLDHDPRSGEPLRRACPVERIVDDVGQLGQIEFGIACDVRDAVSAADVEFVQDRRRAWPDVGHRGDHPADGLAVQGRSVICDPMWQCRPTSSRSWLVQNPFHGRRRRDRR